MQRHDVALMLRRRYIYVMCLPGTVFANRVDPDQLASAEANWSGSALFAIKYVNL